MKKNPKLKMLFVVIFIAVIIACGVAIFSPSKRPTTTLTMGAMMGEANARGVKIGKSENLTTFKFEIAIANIAKPIEIHAVISREKQFRVSSRIARDFPSIDTKQLESNKVMWIKELGLMQPENGSQIELWSGVFVAFDNDLGYIRNLMHSHRIYRKYLNEFEIDYSFSSDTVLRTELEKHIQEIDKQVFDILKSGEAFSK